MKASLILSYVISSNVSYTGFGDDWSCLGLHTLVSAITQLVWSYIWVGFNFTPGPVSNVCMLFVVRDLLRGEGVIMSTSGPVWTAPQHAVSSHQLEVASSVCAFVKTHWSFLRRSLAYCCERWMCFSMEADEKWLSSVSFHHLSSPCPLKDLRCSVVINRSVVHLLLVALTFLSGCGGGVLNWTALWVAHIGAGDWLHFDESNVEPEPVIGTLLCGFSSLFFLPWLAWSMFFLAHCADDLRKQF